MEIYLDANATTPVHPAARAAALAVMAESFGNPSSIHGSGLKARALLDQTREVARRVLGAATGQVIFTSGATEGIQTAVLSALTHLRQRQAGGEVIPSRLLYGATEHKAVPEALRHWNTLLGLDLDVVAIPVDEQGRHDLPWLKAHAPSAGLVCTMAANNETGVMSDLDGISEALAGSGALWLVDGVQALGKLPLQLIRRRIDYAPFSGHKLYAPKGVGLLYVRDGAPYTPLLAGGGQEGALRSGTENMAGIAALGAVLAAVEAGDGFVGGETLRARREQLAGALRAAFPEVVFNTPFAHSLPTTLNFSVPGVSAKILLDLFDAADIRVSGGSACGASRAQPSYVLAAMGLPQWRTESAVRLSFGPADPSDLIDAACERLLACGEALRQHPPVPRVAQTPQTPQTPLADLSVAELEIAPERLKSLLDGAGPQPLLVDVREAFEVGVGSARALQATSIPLSALPEHLARLAGEPIDRPVVFLCRSGNRSAQAARALRSLGRPQAWSLAGGLALWPSTRDDLVTA